MLWQAKLAVVTGLAARTGSFRTQIDGEVDTQALVADAEEIAFLLVEGVSSPEINATGDRGE